MLAHRFHGLELPVRSCTGARAIRVVHPPGQEIGEHRHDWPLLTIPALGGYREECDEGSVTVEGPAVILHPAGRCHANCIHARGMETFSVEFDPDWLRIDGSKLKFTQSHYWIGGEVALQARQLVAAWRDTETADAELQRLTAAILQSAIRHRRRPTPSWHTTASRWLAGASPPSTIEIARRLNLHPAWLAFAYRQAAGEGLHETRIRLRLEQAIAQLRSTDQPIAAVAAGTGFADQSHLHRALRRFTGRTPLQIRQEGRDINALFGSA